MCNLKGIPLTIKVRKKCQKLSKCNFPLFSIDIFVTFGRIIISFEKNKENGNLTTNFKKKCNRKNVSYPVK